MTENRFICTICQEEHDLSQRHTVDEQEICEGCLASETVVCQDCGARIWNDSNEGDTAAPLCPSCYERNFTNCVHCGALLHNDDAYYSNDDPDQEEALCSSCYSRTARPRSIND